MFTLFFFVLILAIGGCAIILNKEVAANPYKVPKKTLSYFVLVVIIVLILPISIENAIAKNDSKLVANIVENHTKQQIYHDTNEDRYFVIEASAWNPLKVQHRTYLDKDKVLEYLKHYNIVQNFSLLN